MTGTNKVAIVAGGTGEVGEGIVRSLLKEGIVVVVPSRSPAKGERLKQFVDNHSNLHLFDTQQIQGDYNEQLVGWTLEKFGKIDFAVASLGGWYHGGRLDQIPTEDWIKVVNNNLNSHFHFAKHIGAYFHEANQGMFVMINGGSAETIVPGSGAMSIISNAQLVMAYVLAAEAKNSKINVYSVMAVTPVKTRSRSFSKKEWPSAEEIGDYILKLYNNPSDKVLHRIQ